MRDIEPTSDEALASAQDLVASDLADLDAAVRARDLTTTRRLAFDLLQRAHPYRAVPDGVAARVLAARASAGLLVRVTQRGILDHYRELECEARRLDEAEYHWLVGSDD
jgi:hypothetical protein